MHINEFQRGAIIVRVEPSIPYPSGVCDGSWIGDKVKLLGVFNGLIHLRIIKSRYTRESSLRLPFHIWNKGWDYWDNPSGAALDDYTLKGAVDAEDIEHLYTLLGAAEADQEFERCAKIRDEINKIKNKNKQI